MNNQQIKEKLLELKDDVPDFTLIMSGKKSKKVDGLYHPETKEIIIHNKNHENDDQLMYTAIHEFAHHIQFTTSAVPIAAKAHTIHFWNIFHNLLYKAEELGIYNNIFTTNTEFAALTERIRNGFLKENGQLMKEFGRLLIEARGLCEKFKVSFSDYLDRVLNIGRAHARSVIKVHNLDINPALGFENMKTVAGIRNDMERTRAQEAFLSGSSPDMVKMQFKTKPAGDDPVAALQKEKTQIKKRIQFLNNRLSEIDNSIKKIEASS